MKKSIRRLLPAAQAFLREPRVRRLFGELLTQPNLWHLNRNSVAWAVSVGLFMAFMPVPSQMILAAAAAILIGCNLPISVAVVWVSNPITFPPLFFAAYKLGAWLLDTPSGKFHFEASLAWLLSELGAVWQPFLLGCFALGLGCAIAGHVVVRVIWRIHVIVSWRERRRRRMAGPVEFRESQLVRERPPRPPGAGSGAEPGGGPGA